MLNRSLPSPKLMVPPALVWALLAMVAIALTGCADGLLAPDAEADVPAEAAVSKLRHSHLMDRAVRVPGKSGTDVGLIFALDPQRVLARYGEIDPQRVLARYESMEEYRVLARYEYEHVFDGYAIWADEDYIDELIAEMSADDEIAWIEPDIAVEVTPLGIEVVSEAGTETTPWGVARIGGGQAGAEGVDLFIIDTGIKDKDLNVASTTDLTDGWGCEGCDMDGHGTHVAGTAAALADGKGVRGVAPGARVHGVRVLTGNEKDDDEAVDLSAAIAAVEHVTGYKLANPNRPVVTNFSLGADVETTAYTALDEAVRASIGTGVTYVVSAGNHGADAATITPAHVEEAITVGAYDPSDRFASFSNYGSLVDLLAPGVDVLSLSPSNSGLRVLSGTSMAAAHVSGAAALFLAQNPHASPAQVASALKGNARAEITGVPSGTTDKTVYLGADEGSGANPGGLLGAEVPPFFQYALTSGNNLRVEAPLVVKAEQSGQNGSVFANNRIAIVEAEGVQIKGFGYFGEAFRGAKRVFRPVNNPTGLSSTMQQAPIDLPDLDVRAYKDRATHTIPTDLTLWGGALTLGTREQPAILYVAGDLTVRRPTRVEGYGIILVEGNVVVNASLQTAAGDETTLGVYVNGNVAIRAENVRLTAQVFAGGSFSFGEHTKIYGSVVSKRSIRVMEEGVRVIYRPSSPVLTEPLWPMAR